MKKVSILLVIAICISLFFTGCLEETATNQKLSNNVSAATEAGAEIIQNQPAPTDLEYSLERYNLIRRAYWVNGQREKAINLPCNVNKPLGYIILFSKSGATIGRFVVDGKVSSLGSYLFPAYIDTDWNGDSAGNQNASCDGSVYTNELPGIDGAYGSNVSGIFFFTTDGKYIEWTGEFLYSDIPFEVSDPVLKVGE